MSDALDFMSGGPVFAAITQGTPFITWLWWLGGGGEHVCGGGCILAAYGTVAETFLDRLPSPWHYADSELRHTPQSFCKKASLLVLKLWPEGQTSGLAHI